MGELQQQKQMRCTYRDHLDQDAEESGTGHLEPLNLIIAVELSFHKSLKTV
jgi:hypothetical protein